MNSEIHQNPCSLQGKDSFELFSLEDGVLVHLGPIENKRYNEEICITHIHKYIHMHID